MPRYLCRAFSLFAWFISRVDCSQLCCDMDSMCPELRQVDPVTSCQSDVLPHSPHDSTVTSPGAIDSPSRHPSPSLDSPTVVERVGPSDSPSTPSLSVARTLPKEGMSVSVGDTGDTEHFELRQYVGERGDAVTSCQSDVLPHSPHDKTVTSPGVIDRQQCYSFQNSESFYDMPTAEEWVQVVPSDSAFTLSQLACLAQHDGPVAPPVSPTFYQMPGTPQSLRDINNIASPNINDTTFDFPVPGAPEPEPPTGTWSFPSNSTASPATTALKLTQCPDCRRTFNCWQDCDRHILTHLPHWIHCPLSDCPWRGNRVKSFEQHWMRKDHLQYYESYGGIPERKHFALFDPQVLLNGIKAGTISVPVAASHARYFVIGKAIQLQKRSLYENDWGYKLKQALQ